MENTGDKLISIIVAIITVATIAVVLSKKANTAAVITSAGSALGDLLKVAMSPITS